MPSSSTPPWLSSASSTAPTHRGASPRRRIPRRTLRRVAAAVLAGVAVWLTLRLLLPAPPGGAVVVLTRDRPAGHVLSDADLTTVHVPREVLPADAVTDPRPAVGRPLAHGASARAILTASTLSQTRDLRDDERAVHVPVADPGTLHATRPGDVVDLVETASGKVVASGVRVLGVDDPAAEKSGHGVLVAAPAGTLTALVPAMSASGPGVAVALRHR